MMVSGTQTARCCQRQFQHEFHPHERAEHDVANDGDDQIGGQIVRAVMMDILATSAAIHGLGKG